MPEYAAGISAKELVIKRLQETNNPVLIETEKDTGKYDRYISTIRLAGSKESLFDE